MLCAPNIVNLSTIICLLHGLDQVIARDQFNESSNEMVAGYGALSYASEPQPLAPNGRQSRMLNGGRGLLSGVLGKVVTGAAHMSKKVALRALKTGKHLIIPPLYGAEWITQKATKLLRKEKELLKNIAHTVKSSWEDAKAIEFPGKSVVAFLFPNSILTIADKMTQKAMHFASKTKQAIKVTVAYSLYATLSVLFKVITTAVKKLGFECIPVPKTSLELNTGVVDAVEISGGKICGLSTLHPDNNITLIHDDDSFLVITMPWFLENVSAKINSIDIKSSLIGSILKDQPFELVVGKIPCKGKISFQKGTILRFVALHLEFQEVTDIKIKLEGVLEEGGMVSGMISSLAEAVCGVIRGLVNDQLVAMEKQISDYILGASLQ